MFPSLHLTPAARRRLADQALDQHRWLPAAQAPAHTPNGADEHTAAPEVPAAPRGPADVPTAQQCSIDSTVVHRG